MAVVVTVAKEVAPGSCLNSCNIEVTFSDYSNHLQHSSVLCTLCVYIYICWPLLRCCDTYLLSITVLYLVNNPLRIARI